ncbi:YciE/YciF ferroxidase family protein [Dyadobacter alkalitolerans]|uniref:YciE/YciF ferroxidase family protein n=1 Tax=Dyadobacter alkalitolerans TaxID=492736 RepID=UPI0004097827|nr:DUF892 family protein [Dyadobacter alkalitolerans]
MPQRQTDATHLRKAGSGFLPGQKVEHYEIASYGTLRNIARTLGCQQAADLLQQTLDQEGETDHILTGLAETYVNEQASAE